MAHFYGLLGMIGAIFIGLSLSLCLSLPPSLSPHPPSQYIAPSLSLWFHPILYSWDHIHAITTGMSLSHTHIVRSFISFNSHGTHNAIYRVDSTHDHHHVHAWLQSLFLETGFDAFLIRKPSTTQNPHTPIYQTACFDYVHLYTHTHTHIHTHTHTHTHTGTHVSCTKYMAVAPY